MIKLTRQDLQDLDSSLAHEWLETNGLGGYASSTVTGINTRKYHGLLVAALKPPIDRILLVARVDETLIIDGRRLDVFSSEYEGAIHPQGFRYLEEVRLDPFPIFTYIVGGVKLEKSVFMVHGENTTCLTYNVACLPAGPRRSQVTLEIRPLVAFRDHHSLGRENPDFNGKTHAEAGRVELKPYENLPTLFISFDSGKFEGPAYWYRNYRYRMEMQRGYPWNEDLFCPGRLVIPFEDKGSHGLLFSTERQVFSKARDVRRNEIERRRKLTEHPVAHLDLGRHLLLAAHGFMANRGEEGRTIIAGYPWFTDWGRDTMVSLPGLTLVTGRYEDAKKIITTYIESMNQGLIPNRFPDFAPEAEYNSIDATLWLFEAVRQYYERTEDTDFVTSILERLRDSINWHLEGTLFSIKADGDGLLRGGQEGTQLTWMDAKVGDKVITARIGKAVEINALWFNALRIMADFCADFGGLAEENRYEQIATSVHEVFNREFWNPYKACLYDLIAGEYKDDSVRPNQILTMSLTYPVLDEARWKSVLGVVEEELLTPYGLRTLSPNDVRYKRRYEGDLESRDIAYHQGTVWPWLLGHYVRAYLRAYGHSQETFDYCWKLLEPFATHLAEAGLGNISEIFDGDPPYHPRGCIAQSWSVAEILRALADDLLGITKYKPQGSGLAF